MRDVTVSIEDVRLVMVRLVRIEGEEFFGDGNRGIACGGDRLEQLEGAAIFLVEHRAREVVATLSAATEKETTANPLVRLVDRDVLARQPRVPNEQPPPVRQILTNDMRPHGPSPWL